MKSSFVNRCCVCARRAFRFPGRVGPAVGGLVLWLGALFAAQPCRAASPLQALQGKILALAKTDATLLWTNLGTGQPFHAASVSTAYAHLTVSPLLGVKTLADADKTFLLTGPFLHLVEESVLVNAAALTHSGHPIHLSQLQLFRAVWRSFYMPPGKPVFFSLQKLQREYEKIQPQPHDPNSLAGPVSSMRPEPGGDMLKTSDRDDMPRFTLAGGYLSPPAYLFATPYVYTIEFENTNPAAPVGPASQVVVADKIDPTYQQVATLQMLNLFWQQNQIFPTACSMNGGPPTSIAPGALAPMPGIGQTATYQFGPSASGLTLQLSVTQLSSTQVQFAWTFQGTLNPSQGGSVSFSILPVSLPTGANINNPAAYAIDNPGADITFYAGMTPMSTMHTNSWP